MTPKHPPELPPNGDSLVGTGLRSVKLGFAEIRVYELGLYVDAKGCRSSLLPLGYGGVDRDGLLRDASSFYSSFASGVFRKTYRIVFCRSLPREKLVGGFAEPLRRRVDPSKSPGSDGQAEKLLNGFVPAGGVSEGDVLSLTCEGDGETLRATFQAKGEEDAKELVSISSGGEGGAWLSFQNIFFDDETQIPTIRVTAVADLPDLLVVSDDDDENEEDEAGLGDESGDKSGDNRETEGEKDGGSSIDTGAEAAEQRQSKLSMKAARQREPSIQEIEAAIDTDFVNKGEGGGKSRLVKWNKFAGRDGKEGYKFGDLTMGVATAMKLKKPHHGTESHTNRDDANQGGGHNMKRGVGHKVKASPGEHETRERREIGAKVEGVAMGVVTGMKLKKGQDDETKELQEKVAKLEGDASSEMEANRKLREKVQTLEDANRRLKVLSNGMERRIIFTRRTWPITLVFAVAVSEITGLALIKIHGVSAVGLSAAKLVLCVLLGGLSAVRYVRMGKLLSKVE